MSEIEELKHEIEDLKRTIIISSKNVLNAKEAALVMGCTPEHIRMLTSRRELPHYPKGNKNYYLKSDIEAYQTEVRVPSQAEIDAEANKYINR